MKGKKNGVGGGEGEEVRKDGKKARWVMEREKEMKGMMNGWEGEARGR